MNDTYAVIHSILTTTFRVPDHEVGPQATLEQLQLDSLALAEFALILEERIGVKLDSAHATRLTTLAEVTEHLDALRRGEAVGAP
ncbi:acyl carrier protein [Streptomyces sp. UNOB3_S3]|uniref:acyl carrier protein n=1 Tax=Streptomyces sp. UNOB3_S3 TaxID=2871682 RepID=UPI001E3AAF1E|nr:acyl carrier protein [Streptomyces sp. UNOB3_S3]MCC3777705.1 acyl carrier protein [Streptomyces sp. UNOB3_S3]